MPQPLHAELVLPKPGTMVGLSSTFTPVTLKGLTLHPENPLLFDFILDTGNSGLQLNQPQLKAESNKLIKYFLAGLALNDDDLWVNLSPYEKNRIVPEALGQTEMGRDMLAQDYMLKQVTASLIYPEKGLGKEFWDKIYKQAQQQFGDAPIPVNTFNKVWIIPDGADVYVHNNTVYIVKAHLKVMLEEDYVATTKNNMIRNDVSLRAQRSNLSNSAKKIATSLAGTRDDTVLDTSQGNPASRNVTSQLIRDLILPAIEKEINEGKNFAQLRQIYQTLILSTWFKATLKANLLNQIYANTNKIAGTEYQHSIFPTRQPGDIVSLGAIDAPIESVSPSRRQANKPMNVKGKAAQSDTALIYQQYLAAYKKGVFNYIKEDIDRLSQQPIERKYFSGGTNFKMKVNQLSGIPSIDPAMGTLFAAQTSIAAMNDLAMATLVDATKLTALVETYHHFRERWNPQEKVNRQLFVHLLGNLLSDLTAANENASGRTEAQQAIEKIRRLMEHIDVMNLETNKQAARAFLSTLTEDERNDWENEESVWNRFLASEDFNESFIQQIQPFKEAFRAIVVQQAMNDLLAAYSKFRDEWNQRGRNDAKYDFLQVLVMAISILDYKIPRFINIPESLITIKGILDQADPARIEAVRAEALKYKVTTHEGYRGVEYPRLLNQFYASAEYNADFANLLKPVRDAFDQFVKVSGVSTELNEAHTTTAQELDQMITAITYTGLKQEMELSQDPESATSFNKYSFLATYDQTMDILRESYQSNDPVLIYQARYRALAWWLVADSMSSRMPLEMKAKYNHIKNILLGTDAAMVTLTEERVSKLSEDAAQVTAADDIDQLKSLIRENLFRPEEISETLASLTFGDEVKGIVGNVEDIIPIGRHTYTSMPVEQQVGVILNAYTGEELSYDRLRGVVGAGLGLGHMLKYPDGTFNILYVPNDQALIANNGGIDFNSQLIKIKQTGKMPQTFLIDPAMMGQLREGKFTGLTPTIIKMTVIDNLPQLLGVLQ